jgi:type I restriction enzyme, S subunit
MIESPRDLPTGWTVKSVADVTQDVKSIDPAKFPEQTFHYVDISSIDNERQRITAQKPLLGAEAPSRARRPIKDGDVLFSNVRTYLRNIAPVRDVVQPAVASTGFTLLRPTDEITQDYLLRIVVSDAFIRQVTPLQTGSQYPATSDRVVRGQLIPVPPVEVQQQITSLLDAVDERRNVASESIERARRLLEEFRQTLLELACSGRLTDGWRRTNQVEPTSAWLPELRSKQSINSGRRKVAAPDESALPALPDTWMWACVGEVADVHIGGTPSRKTPEYWDGSVAWVSSGEVANCRISTTRERITASGLRNSNAKIYPAGTVLIAMIGEGKTRGQSAILDIAASTNQNAAGVLPDANLIDPEYLWKWALEQYEVTRAAGRGGNQLALNAQKVRELVIPIPPLEEQREIVRRVDEMFKVSEDVIARVDAASSLLDRTTQAALAKAFRGELLE